MSESVSSGASSVEAVLVENLEDFTDRQELETTLQEILNWTANEKSAPSMSTEEWAHNHHMILSIRRFCQFAPDKLSDHLNHVFRIPLSMTSNLRSAVARNALFCIKELIGTSKEFLRGNTECQHSIADSLLARMASEKKFICTAARESLVLLGKETGNTDLLRKFMRYAHHKHPQIVAESAKCVNATLSGLTREDIDEPLLHELIDKAGMYLEGRLPEVRESAKFMVKRIVRKFGKDCVKSEIYKVCDNKNQPIRRRALLRLADTVNLNQSCKPSPSSRPMTATSSHQARPASQHLSVRNQIKADKDRLKQQKTTSAPICRPATAGEKMKTQSRPISKHSNSMKSANEPISKNKIERQLPKNSRSQPGTNDASSSKQVHEVTKNEQEYENAAPNEAAKMDVDDGAMQDNVESYPQTTEPGESSKDTTMDYGDGEQQCVTSNCEESNIAGDQQNQENSPKNDQNIATGDENEVVMENNDQESARQELNSGENDQPEEAKQSTTNTEAEPLKEKKTSKRKAEQEQPSTKRQTRNSRKHVRELSSLDTENIISTPHGVKRRPRTRAAARNLGNENEELTL